jgi:hypothetical protein
MCRNDPHFFYEQDHQAAAGPDDVGKLIADIAFSFHWPLSELEAMSVDDLLRWQPLAIERTNLMFKAMSAGRL